MSFGGSFKLFYHGVSKRRNNVGKRRAYQQVELKRRSDRMRSKSTCVGSSVGRALAFGPQGHRFDSGHNQNCVDVRCEEKQGGILCGAYEGDKTER